MSKVKPLKRRIMTLDELRAKTLDMIRCCRKQFRKGPYEDGMTDEEFIDDVLNDFECQINCDIEMEKIIAQNAEQTWKGEP